MSAPDRHPETLAGDVANAARIPVTGGVLYFGERRSNPDAALLDTHAVDTSGRANHWIYTDLTREQGTALRDALNTWLEPDGDTPAPAASRPASQAVTGAAEHPAASVARDDEGPTYEQIDRSRAEQGLPPIYGIPADGAS